MKSRVYVNTKLTAVLGVMVLLLLLPCSKGANPDFASSQGAAGWTANRWSYMTAWNLSSGALSVGTQWYNGRQVMNHAVVKQQWIARFIYDQSTGQTRQLSWFYYQDHVQ